METDWLLSDVEVLEDQPALGKGAYGIVYRARWKGIEVAAKRVHDTLAKGINGATNTAVQGIEDEGERMRRLRHPHLVQFLGVYYDDLKRLHLVMEKMKQSLADLLEESGGPLFDMKIYSIGTDVTSALRYMHELPTPIAHRDLTPKNILLSADLRAKVSDLGACKHVIKLHVPMTATLAPGNPKYMPPEALEGGHHAKYVPTAVDVFSLGIVLLEMFSGTDPEPSTYNTFQKCPSDPTKYYRVPEEERRCDCFKKITRDHPLTELIRKCIDVEHNQRPPMREIQGILSALVQSKPVPRVRSKLIQSTVHASPQEKAHPTPVEGESDVYDDVVPEAGASHHYENIPSMHTQSPLNGPTLPPKGERNLQQCASDKHTKQERMMSPWNATSKQQSPSPDPPGALQPAEYEPLHIPFQCNEESRIRTGSEGVDTEISPDSYRPLGPVNSGSERVYEDPNLPHPQLKRAATCFSSRTQEKPKVHGRAPRTVYKSQRVDTGQGLPPLPPRNIRRASHVPNEESPVYDIIEEVETVLKVTESCKKKHTIAKSVVQKNGHTKLAALSATQNELLVSLGRVADQSEMLCARNSEGKSGLIADTQVQVVEPVAFNHTSDSSPGILQHLTYKAGPKVKAIHISSSKIAKGSLETLTSLANTDIVAVDKPSSGGSAFFKIDFFKHRLVRVEGYLLQWTAVIGRFGYPLQWMVEMSMDGDVWKEVGREQQSTTTETSQYWEVKQKSLGRYLRISLLDANSKGNNMLCLNGIELYGDLYSSVDDQYI